MNSNIYNAISLFTGALGMDLGLHRTRRFRLLACADMSAACCETIRINRNGGRLGDSSVVIYEADVRRLDPEMIMANLGLRRGDLDLLVGCPPCQTFSVAGLGQGVHDPRGLLLWEMHRFVDAIQPRTFLLENVPGLMNATLNPSVVGRPLGDDERPGSVIRAFLDGMPHGYRVDCFLVNAANYGVPQSRERVILVGNRLGALAEFPGPTHGGTGQPSYRTLGDALAGLIDPDPVIEEFPPRIWRFLAEVPAGGNWTSISEDELERSFPLTFATSGGRTGWFRRPALDRPCPTVLCSPCSMYSTLCHPTEPRAMSVRECARVQGFHDDWVFTGSVTEQYMQVGNAVPIRLGEISGMVVADLLDKAQRRDVGGSGHPRWRIVQLRSRIRLVGSDPDERSQRRLSLKLLRDEERETVGGFSEPTKMPWLGWSIPAEACKAGGRLKEIPGTVCHDCYACKGRYRFPGTKESMERRFASLADLPRWTAAMIRFLRDRATRFVPRVGDAWPAFRWFDAGDLQNPEHLDAICKIAEGTQDVELADAAVKDIRHWLPTREYGFVETVLQRRGGDFPRNLAVRLSAHMIDGPPPKAYGLPVSSVHTKVGVYADAWHCPAYRQGGRCKACRACWDRRIVHVSYPYH